MAFFKNDDSAVLSSKIPQIDPESITMSKKDFAEIAGIIKGMDHMPEEYRQQFALAFIHFFQARNERFNECKFIEACGFANLVDVKMDNLDK